MSAELRDQVLSAVRGTVDAATVAAIEAAFDDAARITVIRDAFLEGRDLDAVRLVRELGGYKLRKVLSISSSLAQVPTQSAQIFARPQLPFTPTAIVVAQSCARSFVIHDIRVVQRSQFVQAGEVDAELAAADVPIMMEEAERLQAAPDSGELDALLTIRIDARAEGRLGLPIDMPEVLPGQEIVIDTMNIGTQDARFRGILLGTTRGH